MVFKKCLSKNEHLGFGLISGFPEVRNPEVLDPKTWIMDIYPVYPGTKFYMISLRDPGSSTPRQ
jgi:hypothetical protein